MWGLCIKNFEVQKCVLVLCVVGDIFVHHISDSIDLLKLIIEILLDLFLFSVTPRSDLHSCPADDDRLWHRYNVPCGLGTNNRDYAKFGPNSWYCICRDITTDL